MKFKLRHKFSQFINRFKTGVDWGCTSKFLPIHKDILVIFPSWWRSGKIGFFENNPRLLFQIFANSLKSWEIAIFKFLVIFLDCKDILLGLVCLQKSMFVSRKRNVNIYITILRQFKCWKYSFQAQMRGKVPKFSWRRNSPQNPQLCLEQTKFVRRNLALRWSFPICKISPIIDQCNFFNC